MYRHVGFFGLVVLVASSLIAAAEPNLQAIFNGNDLTGWKVCTGPDSWRAQDGILIGASDEALAESHLCTEEHYQDFILEFDVRWAGEIDSGILFREPMLQVQLGVSRSLQRDMSGSFYAGPELRYPESGQAQQAAALLKPEGSWNRFRLEARGDTFRVWINGELAARYTNADFAGAAPIALQVHSGLKMRVEFRNLRIAKL